MTPGFIRVATLEQFYRVLAHELGQGAKQHWAQVSKLGARARLVSPEGTDYDILWGADLVGPDVPRTAEDDARFTWEEEPS